MKKVFCLVVLLSMALTMFFPVNASHVDEHFVPEKYSYDELLAMDETLDSDCDGLSDVLELFYQFNRYSQDTDNDGVSDDLEFYVTGTDVLVPDGEIDSDGDGLTNAQECTWGAHPGDLDSDNDNLSDFDECTYFKTNPASKDTDGDGIHDKCELELGLNPLVVCSDGVTMDIYRFGNSVICNDVTGYGSVNGTADLVYAAAVNPDIVITNPDVGSETSTTLITEFGRSGVSYYTSYDSFWTDNVQFNTNIATLSALLSAMAYDASYLENTGTTAETSENALKDWFHLYAFTRYASYDLNVYDAENPPDQYGPHVTEVFIACKDISNVLGNMRKPLICVVIRGTNGTLEEWQSNFDVGTTGDFGAIEGWTNSTNHKGFDITANRLNAILTDYLEENNLNNENYTLWITGHSRGGALANVLAAKRCDMGDDVYAYTFAAPCTTTYETATTAPQYQCIFNIINDDDLVPQLPLTSWNFRRYGQDRSASIESDYASEWDSLMGNALTYTSNPTSMRAVVEKLGRIASNRNECYEYRTGIDAYYVDALYPTYEAGIMAATAVVEGYPPNVFGTYYWVPTGSASYSGYAMYQQPAFLMQLIAALQGGALSEGDFVLTRVAPYLGPAKEKLVVFAGSGNMEHPHFPESYYLLARNIAG